MADISWFQTSSLILRQNTHHSCSKSFRDLDVDVPSVVLLLFLRDAVDGKCFFWAFLKCVCWHSRLVTLSVVLVNGSFIKGERAGSFEDFCVPTNFCPLLAEMLNVF